MYLHLCFYLTGVKIIKMILVMYHCLFQVSAEPEVFPRLILAESCETRPCDTDLSPACSPHVKTSSSSTTHKGEARQNHIYFSECFSKISIYMLIKILVFYKYFIANFLQYLNKTVKDYSIHRVRLLVKPSFQGCGKLSLFCQTIWVI